MKQHLTSLLRFIAAGLFFIISSQVGLAKNVALIIGNESYSSATPLANPANDATKINEALQELGFETLVLIDGDRRAMAQVLSAFSRKIEGADTALFFYAGHGMQLGGQNYLLGVDARVENEFALDGEAVKLSSVLSLMETNAKLSMAFIDACRDNPLSSALQRRLGRVSRSLGVTQGLAPLDRAYRDTLVAYATTPGEVAFDGVSYNSPFTSGLLNHIATPNIEVSTMLKRVTADVLRATEGQQQPEIVAHMSREFYFRTALVKPEPKPLQLPVAPQENTNLAKQQLEDARAILDPTRRDEALRLIIKNHSGSTESEIAQFLLDADPVEAERRLMFGASDYREVQRKLNDLGFFVGSADGKFGSKSRKGLELFQRAYALRTTGFVDHRTLQTLENASADAPSTFDGTYIVEFRRTSRKLEKVSKNAPGLARAANDIMAAVRIEFDGKNTRLVSKNEAMPGMYVRDLKIRLEQEGRISVAGVFGYGGPLERAPFRSMSYSGALPKKFSAGRLFDIDERRLSQEYRLLTVIRRIE